GHSGSQGHASGAALGRGRRARARDARLMFASAPDDGSLFALAVLGVAVAVLAAYAVSIALFGRPSVERLDNEPGTMLLGRFPIEAFHWAARGIGRALVRTGISPDVLTWLSVVVAALAVPLAAAG